MPRRVAVPLYVALLMLLMPADGAPQTPVRPAPGVRPATDVTAQLAEANAHFTFKGEPIHPLAVGDLLAWMSDAYPGPVAGVELAGGYHSNRYDGDFQATDGKVVLRQVNEAGDETKYLSYERIGRLANGCHVIETHEGGGGTGVFINLLLVTFDIDYEYDDTGRRRPRLVMNRRLEIPVGDRFDGPIRVTPHEIRIGPGKIAGDRVPEPARVLKFN